MRLISLLRLVSLSLLSVLCLTSVHAGTEFTLDGFRECAQADNKKFYCKTNASSNWQQVTPEFFNRFKSASAEAAAGGAKGVSKDIQEIADFLNDASQFLKENPKTKNLSEIAKAAVATKSALDSQDLTAARNGKRQLEALFKDDPAFIDYMKALSAERQGQIDRKIVEAAAETDKNIFFIDSYITANLLSPNTTDLGKLKDLLTKALKENNLNGLNTANSGFAKFIQEQNLTAEYQSALLAFAEANLPKNTEDPSTKSAEIQEIADFLNDVSQFLKENPKTKNLGEIAKTAVTMKSAIGAQDLLVARNGKRQLEALFKDVPAFTDYLKRLSAERQVQIDRKVAEAAVETNKNIFFIDSYVTANLLSPHTTDLGQLKDLLAKALQENNLKGLNSANSGFLKFIEKQKLSAEYQSALLAFAEANTPKSAEDPNSKSALAKKLGVTERSQFIIDGDNDDIVVIYNSLSGRFVKSLKGDLVFKSKTMKLCVAQDRQIPTMRDLERVGISAIRAKVNADYELSQLACPIDALDQFDIVFFQRLGLLSQSEDYVRGLISLIEKKNFTSLMMLPGKDVNASLKGSSLSAAQIEATILGGQKSGFGLIYNGANPDKICLAVQDDTAAHEIAARDQIEKSLQLKSETISFVQRSIDDAFADYQGGKCNAVYSNAENMAQLIAALKRERLDYLVAPLWVTAEDIASINKDQQAKVASILAQQEAVRKAIAEQDAILQQRATDAAAKRENIEKDLQNKNKAFARAAQDSVSNVFDAFLKENTERKGEKVSGDAVLLFPDFADLVSQMTRDRWELEQVNYEVEDYGNVDWQARMLEGAIIKTSVSMKNAALGRRDTVCAMLGVIIDKEFTRLRDPITTSCEDGTPSLDRWRIGSKFVSRWRAPPEQ